MAPSVRNPLKTDPTRTTTLRRRAVADVARRYRKLQRAILHLVVTEDAFGLRDRESAVFNAAAVVRNTRWAFVTDSAKITEFRKWLQDRIASDIEANQLTVDPRYANAPWLSPYIGSAYRQGLVRAYTDINASALATSPDFYEGSRAQFLIDAFNAPERRQTLELIFTRSYEQLRGVNEQMASRMSTVLADGFAQGRGPIEVARNLNTIVGTIGRTRAETIARTEIIHAHAEGQLDGFEELGVDSITAMAEWLTAGDGKVCPLCASLSGVVMTVKEARGLIPRHPNCRCAWTPANVGEKPDGQKRDKTQIEEAVEASIKAERPKLDSETARTRTTWAGADRRISKRRPKPIVGKPKK